MEQIWSSNISEIAIVVPKEAQIEKEESLITTTITEKEESLITSTITTITTTTTTLSVGKKRTLEEVQATIIDLSTFENVNELEKLGLDVLKAELIRLGLKFGGNNKQRAERLWMTKGLTPDQFDSNIFANNKKRKNK